MWQNLLSIFLESRCPMCDRTTEKIVCIYCDRKLRSYQVPQRERFWRQKIPLFPWGKYDGQLKQAIAKMKYEKQPAIARMLGQWLGEAWIDSAIAQRRLMPIAKTRNISVIPIPLHRERQKTRGYNQAEIIARGFCQVTGYSMQAQGLRRQRNTKAMYDLKPTERSKNLQNAFAIGKKKPKSPILLIDDIYTTGSTTTEAIRVLEKHQIEVLGVLVTSKA